MRDDFQFAVLGLIAVCLVAAEVVLAVTNSGPTELHAALLIVLGGLLGVAGTKAKAPPP
jgi:hypothetical protein